MFIKKIQKEFEVFRSYPHSMRTLLTANMIYALMMPILELFVAAYVMRDSNDVRMVMIYQVSLYVAVPLPFFLTGWLLRHVNVKRLYSAGLLITGVLTMSLMSLGKLTIPHIIAVGFMMGIAAGFYWANRDFLVLTTTNDSNRNYYYGIEFLFTTLCYIMVPAVVGAFIGATESRGWMGGDPINAYRIVGGVLFLLSVVASVVIHQSNYEELPKSKFIYLKFHPLWKNVSALIFVQGIMAGYIVSVPAMLVMTLVGKEQSLGFIQAAGGIVSAIVLYVIGRISKPKHRMLIMSIGTIALILCTIPNALLFNAFGVFCFVIGLTFARPMIDFSAYPIRLLGINTVSAIEKRNEFAYILNIEFWMVLGRSTGCAFFIVLAYVISENFSLRYALVFVSVLQLGALYFAQKIVKAGQAV